MGWVLRGGRAEGNCGSGERRKKMEVIVRGVQGTLTRRGEEEEIREELLD